MLACRCELALLVCLPDGCPLFRKSVQSFQRIRDYRQTTLEVDPSGFEVQTEASDAFREVKNREPAIRVSNYGQNQLPAYNPDAEE